MLAQIYEVRAPEEAVSLACLGVDHIGVLVGDGAFPRELTADRANAIFAALPPGARRVALSLSANPAEIARIVKETRPDIIHIGAAVELFSLRDTQMLKAAFPNLQVMRSIPVVDEASIECVRRTIRALPTSCCSTAMSPATDRSAGLAARTTGASADALSTKRVCGSSLPAASTPTTPWRRLPQCVRRASISKTNTDRADGNGRDLDKVGRFVTAAKLTMPRQ